MQDSAEGQVARQVPYDDASVPYLYASDSKELSLTYAVTKGVRLGNMSGGKAGIEILFVEREGIIGDPELEGRLYSFDSDRFTQVINDDGPTNQWVSAEPLNLRQAEYLPVRSLNDLMKAGIQVYQIADHADYDSYEFYKDWTKQTDEAGCRDSIQQLLQSGKMRWLNQERSIHPVDYLNEEIDNSQSSLPRSLPPPVP